MIESIYLIILIASLGLGILSFIDRLFGIVGVIISWMGGIQLMSDATLVTQNTLNINTGQYVSYSIPFIQVEICAIILGIIGIVDVFIVMKLSTGGWNEWDSKIIN